VGIATLLATAVEGEQFQRIGKSIVEKINSTESAIRELNILFDSSKIVTDLLPPSTLQWRLERYLLRGNYLMDGRYNKITSPTLILIGSRDRLLPSLIEGRKLRDKIINAPVELLEFSEKGHAILDDTVDLHDIILKSKFFKKPKEVSVGVSYPSQNDINAIEKQFGWFFKGTSPIFLSRASNGKLQRGIANVPVGVDTGRPVLLVGNHQLYGADLGIIVRQFLQEKSTLVRGLAHPVLFADDGNGFGGRDSTPESMNNADESQNSRSMKDLFTKFGAVEVSPSSIFSLLQRNETVLLFPGGVREAYHGKGEEYALFWPEKVDFVRMAGLFGAIIVPFAAIGIADSVEMIFDADEILRLPVLGDRAKEFNARVPSARAGVKDNFISPISIPKVPSRCYFLFEESYDTRDIDIYDKAKCAKIYNCVKARVQDGIQTLKRFRNEDPYNNFFRRNIYESMMNKQAPTAPLNLKQI